MDNYAVLILIGDTLLGTVLFIGFALAVKGLAGELKTETPEAKPVAKPAATRSAESKA